MSTRETVEIKTPDEKHTLIVNAYITGREMRQVENIYLESTEIDTRSQRPVKNISGEVADHAQDKLFELMIVSFDGSAENIINRLLDLPSNDYKYIRDRIKAVVDGVDIKKKA